VIARIATFALAACVLGCSFGMIQPARPLEEGHPGCQGNAEPVVFDLLLATASVVGMVKADADARTVLALPVLLYGGAAIYGAHHLSRCKRLAESAPVIVPYRAPPPPPPPPPRRCFTDPHCPEGTVCDGDGQCRRLPPLAPITL
jgi:hypothetical protein